MINEQLINKDITEVRRGLTYGRSRHCPGVTEGNHEILHSGWPTFLLKYETVTCRIEVTGDTACASLQYVMDVI
jgi:hypothetical protein